MISAQETVQSQLIRTEVHGYRLGDGNIILMKPVRIRYLIQRTFL